MMDYHLGRDDRDCLTSAVELSEEEMEWILNSLREMQVRQQELANTQNGVKITRADIISSMGGIPIPDDREVTSDDIGDVFRTQHSDVTNLREKLVKFVGRDLTDG